MEPKDYYSILGVTENADQRQIREAYRRLALEYHPDRNKDTAASSRMKEINEAYAVLSNPEKRREYEALQHSFGAGAYTRFRQNYTEQDIFRGSDIHQVYDEISRVFGFRSFEEIFRESYGPRYRTFEFRQPGSFGRGFVFTPFRGRGSGGIRGSLPGGSIGKILKFLIKRRFGVEFPEKGKDLEDRLTIPSALARDGGKIRYHFRLRTREFLVTIPAGIGEGQRIRLRGMGEPGKGGGEPGDLYIQVRIRRPLLERVREFIGRFFHKDK